MNNPPTFISQGCAGRRSLNTYPFLPQQHTTFVLPNLRHFNFDLIPTLVSSSLSKTHSFSTNNFICSTNAYSVSTLLNIYSIQTQASIKMHSTALSAAALLLAGLRVANAQTFTDCNPLDSKCLPSQSSDLILTRLQRHVLPIQHWVRPSTPTGQLVQAQIGHWRMEPPCHTDRTVLSSQSTRIPMHPPSPATNISSSERLTPLSKRPRVLVSSAVSFLNPMTLMRSIGSGWVRMILRLRATSLEREIPLPTTVPPTMMLLTRSEPGTLILSTGPLNLSSGPSMATFFVHSPMEMLLLLEARTTLRLP